MKINIPKTNILIISIGAIIIGGVLYYLLTYSSSGPVFKVDDFLAAPVGEQVRLEGVYIDTYYDCDCFEINGVSGQGITVWYNDCINNRDLDPPLTDSDFQYGDNITVTGTYNPEQYGASRFCATDIRLK